MRCAVLGTGIVGRTLADKLVGLGHEVAMGSRTMENAEAVRWADQAGRRGRSGAFADAAAFGDTVIVATGGRVALEALAATGEGSLDGKVVIDVSNPLAFEGDELRLDPVESDSVGERIQRAYPRAHVVKALNMVNSAVMVEPATVPGDHALFICGDDVAAKARVRELLGEFGWPAHRVFDLGGITAARGMEAYLLLWMKLMRTLGHAEFNIEVRRSR